MVGAFEIGPIRPPSEAYSLLIRVTRNCPWNRCKFCHTYKGAKFQLRTVDEIKQEIETARDIYDRLKVLAAQSGYGDSLQEAAATVLSSPPNEAFYNVALWQYSGGENVFLQDANTLLMPTEPMVEVISFLKATFPGIKRITSYGRSHTAARKKPAELRKLHEAGLSRLHIGLESGYDPLLKYMDKGVTAADHIKGGRNVVESGISLCQYVILGLGGKTMWREHAIETARVLNEIRPDFIRVRTLSVNKRMPLYEEVEKGNFVRATDEEIIKEERLFLENLKCPATFVSDHITNLLQELEGKLAEDKSKFLATIDRFLALSADDRLNFMIGRRMGIYNRLDEMKDTGKRKAVDQFMARISCNGSEIDDKAVFRLMERFI